MKMNSEENIRERRAESRERRAEGREQRAESDEQREVRAHDSACHPDEGAICLLKASPRLAVRNRLALYNKLPLLQKLPSCTAGMHKYTAGKGNVPAGRVMPLAGLHKYTAGRVIRAAGKGFVPAGREKGLRHQACHFEGRMSEKSATKVATCNGFLASTAGRLSAFGMTEENAGMQECKNAGIRLEDKSPATEMGSARLVSPSGVRGSEGSNGFPASTAGRLIAFEMTGAHSSQLEASSLTKRNSTVFHSSQFLQVSSCLPTGGSLGEIPLGKGGITISFPKSVHSTANEQGMEVFSLRSSFSSGFPLWGNARREGGRAEELAIRACEILRFFNNQFLNMREIFTSQTEGFQGNWQRNLAESGRILPFRGDGAKRQGGDRKKQKTTFPISRILAFGLKTRVKCAHYSSEESVPGQGVFCSLFILTKQILVLTTLFSSVPPWGKSRRERGLI